MLNNELLDEFFPGGFRNSDPVALEDIGECAMPFNRPCRGYSHFTLNYHFVLDFLQMMLGFIQREPRLLSTENLKTLSQSETSIIPRTTSSCTALLFAVI